MKDKKTQNADEARFEICFRKIGETMYQRTIPKFFYLRFFMKFLKSNDRNRDYGLLLIFWVGQHCKVPYLSKQ